jgi:RNA polymerase sigma factor (TIGR02999 family)
MMKKIIAKLDAIERGDPQAADELLRTVYTELRRLAARKLAGEKPGQTLQATELVHEAYLKLTAGQPRLFNGRSHFLAAAAEAMRRILIDRARRRKSQRGGGNCLRVEFREAELAMQEEDDQLLALNEALEKLAQTDPLKARVVQLRYFAGLTHAQVADVLDVSEPTSKRHWIYARAWLFRAIQNQTVPTQTSP